MLARVRRTSALASRPPSRPALNAIRICLRSAAAFISPAMSAPIELRLVSSNYFVLAELVAYLRNSHCHGYLPSLLSSRRLLLPLAARSALIGRIRFKSTLPTCVCTRRETSRGAICSVRFAASFIDRAVRPS